MTARVRLDAGTRHILAWCSVCAPWRVMTDDRPAAHLQAADHLERVHGTPQAKALAKEHRRHARETPGG